MPESSLLPAAAASSSASATVADAGLMREVAELVVSALNLDTAAADIQPDEPLYGEGLGLDSIDILEIALVLSKRYGLQLRADHEDNTAIFQSLRSLTEHIALQRSK
ncbi:MAG: phosphopantetheine-binding protein [Polaromonas sp.]|uniref:phosphopantetheine-binding protein n=1 Tax=Polaromonas sp. TaxID=1869339 RepID=UPI00272F13E4|nr:phosphopantetheine-binding protein [Polaromonas sp.]MDP1742551.1 phosphopantetheine-binding protein [Polaromonas sp.]MDP1954919.1 phosphopantetheine-binding protein [Polaromonas sp.]MDP3354981.1 phosphopantetheine-binding protein [Polaromonas sp.]MDP3752426.1 phosphopantetheine-binding protein [Polaromonas sp.]